MAEYEASLRQRSDCIRKIFTPQQNIYILCVADSSNIYARYPSGDCIAADNGIKN